MDKILQRLDSIDLKLDSIIFIHRNNNTNNTTDIDDIINDTFSTLIDVVPYTKHNEDMPDTIDWEALVAEQIPTRIRMLITKENAYYEELNDAYKQDSVYSIFELLRKKIPKNIIRVADKARSKFYLYSNGKWLNPIDTTIKMNELITLLQDHLFQLHNIVSTICEIDGDTYLERLNKINQLDINKKIINQLIWWYSDEPM
jgi:hypothetical protein